MQCLNVIRRGSSVGNHDRALSTWRTRTGSSNISPSMALSRTVYKGYFTGSACTW